MLLHYKAIIMDESTDFIGKLVIEKKRKKQIDYCCEEMERAISTQAIDIMGIEVSIQHSDYDGYTTDYYPSISFCPFCGEKIEVVEEYRVKQKTYTAHIQEKVIPAHTERRSKEVRVAD